MPSITNEEWQIAEDLLELLAPLESVTRLLCGETYATASLIIPAIREVISHLTTLVLKSKSVLKLRVELIKNLKDRFSLIEVNDVLSMATYLDPRFKLATFSDDSYCKAAINKSREQLIANEPNFIETQKVADQNAPASANSGN